MITAPVLLMLATGTASSTEMTTTADRADAVDASAATASTAADAESEAASEAATEADAEAEQPGVEATREAQPEAPGKRKLPISFGAEVSTVSTYYFRGAVLSARDHQPALQNSANLALDVGLYTGLWTSNILARRADNRGSDELDITLGFAKSWKWAGFNAGLVEYINYNPNYAGIGELFVNISGGDGFKVATPVWRNFVALHGQDAAGNPLGSYWFTELGVNFAQTVKGNHSFSQSLTFGSEITDQYRATDLRANAGYTYTFDQGPYLTGAIEYDFAIQNRKNLVWGKVAVGYQY